LADALDEWVRGELADLTGPESAVLCHNDYNQGNLMVGGRGAPSVCGVFDWERACWDDPMRDLARIHHQVGAADSTLLPALRTGYGPLDAPARSRLTLHELLRLADERAWIATDRPQGWRRSITRLDRALTNSIPRA